MRARVDAALARVFTGILNGCYAGPIYVAAASILKSKGTFYVYCSPGTNCFELVKVLSPAFVALVIGVIAARITYNQYLVAQAKLKLDLFERRFKVFQLTWNAALDTARRGARVQERDDLFTPFNSFIPEAAFLFGKDIEAYIHELASNWTALHKLETKDWESMHSTDSRSPPGLLELRVWFSEQANKGVKSRFSAYLDFANWK